MNMAVYKLYNFLCCLHNFRMDIYKPNMYSLLNNTLHSIQYINY